MAKTEEKGLGDLVAEMFTRMGIKQCGGCKKRQDWLNQLSGKGVNRNGEKRQVKQEEPRS